MSRPLKLPEHPFYADMDGPLAIAHRGGDAAGQEKENSLAAFDSAWREGIVYGETDTVATVDGVALAIHGSRSAKQARKTGLPLRSQLEAMTFDEVQREVRIGGEQVPAVEELIFTFPGMRFFIDPKTTSSVKPLADLIKDYKLKNTVSVGAFDYRRTRGCGRTEWYARRAGYYDRCMGQRHTAWRYKYRDGRPLFAPVRRHPVRRAA